MRSSRVVRWAFTGNSAVFLFVLGSMWYAASSQQNAAAYLLLFGLASIGIVSIPHAFVNVAGLTARADSIKPAFAGQEATLPIEVSNSGRSSRHGIGLHLPDARTNRINLTEVAPGKAVRSTIRFPVEKRGEHQITGI